MVYLEMFFAGMFFVLGGLTLLGIISAVMSIVKKKGGK